MRGSSGVRRSFAVVCALLLVAGCSGGSDPEVAGPTTVPPPDAVASAPPAPPEAPTTEAATEPEPTEEEDDEDVAYPSTSRLRDLGAAATCDLIGDEYCDDANGNLWPDFVESELGQDPAADECTQDDCGGATTQEILVETQDNTLFILDASGSMAGDAGGVSKMDAAKQALVDYVSVTPDFADLGLMVYGHRGDNSDAGRAESCAGIETFAQIGDLTPETAADVVGQFSATGWTPIGASLDAAGPVLQAAADADAAEGLEGATNRIILISDGIETCDGDPVASAQALVDLGIQVVVDVIGFDLAEADRAALQQVADATGGIYRDAANAQGLRDALREYIAQRAQVQEVINCRIRADAANGSCRVNFAADALSVLLAEGEEARRSDDLAERERGRFIGRWALQVDDEYEDVRQQMQSDATASLEELQAEIAESLERSEESLGQFQKVALRPTFTCPYDDDVGGDQGVQLA